MDDYRDQDTWYEVQERTRIDVPGLDGFTVPTPWETVATADTEVEADGVAAEYRELDDESEYRVVPVRGLA